MAGRRIVSPGNAGIARGTALLALLAALGLAAGAADALARQRPETVVTGKVLEIVDGDTLVLDTGAQVRLVGIQAPKLPLGRRGFRRWPLAAKARAALGELTLGKTLRLSYGGRSVDRHGRLLAHLHDPGNVWIQGRLLARGMARVYTFSDNRSRAGAMLALERQARLARRGIWGHSFYRVLGPAETTRFIDTFQLVEGRVLSAAVVRGRAYLNFGSDWRSDFTITVAPKTMRLFRRAGISVSDYEGRRVRVRGWLKSYNGPMIEATHPEQIEELGE